MNCSHHTIPDTRWTCTFWRFLSSSTLQMRKLRFQLLASHIPDLAASPADRGAEWPGTTVLSHVLAAGAAPDKPGWCQSAGSTQTLSFPGSHTASLQSSLEHCPPFLFPQPPSPSHLPVTQFPAGSKTSSPSAPSLVALRMVGWDSD